MHELVIIGAGPHALSLLTALMEPHTDKYLEHPSNSLLFHRSGAEANNFESQAIIARGHQYNALRRQRKSEKEVVDNALNGVGKRGRRSKVAGQTDDPSLSWIKENVVVLDRLGCTQCNNRNNNHGLGDWMPFWRKQMDFLRVPHLRSPVTHHPDPIDRFILWQYAMTLDRKSEVDLVPLKMPRNPSYTGPFLLPSTDLFWDFCGKALVQGFDIEGMVQQADVLDVIPVACDCQVINDKAGEIYGVGTEAKFCDHFEIVLRSGQVIHARNVVLATGSDGERRIPSWVSNLEGSAHPKHCCAHCFDIALDPEAYLAPFRRTSPNAETPLIGKKVVIVGGGITSIHLSRVALDLGTTDLHLLARSSLRIQPFDVDIEWFGPHRPTQIASFWSESNPINRLNQLRKARFPANGDCSCGSGATVTTESIDLIKDGLEDGRMTIMEEVEVVAAEWFAEGEGRWELFLSDGTWMVCDMIWLATGTKPTTKLLSKIRKYHPIPHSSDLPVLRPDLSWSDTCPGLFIMGPLSALEIGPGAPNLMGGRLAAGRIVKSLRERLAKAYRAGA